MRVRFQIDRRAHGDSTIWETVSWGGLKVKASTGLRVMPADWSQAAQRVKGRGSHEKNVILAELRNSIERKFVEFEFVHNRFPTVIEVREMMSTGQKRKRMETVVQFIDRFIQDSELSLAATGLRKSRHTIKRYKITLERMVKFSVEKKYELRWDTMSMEFYNRFTQYMSENNLAANTFGKYISVIKVFLREADAAGLPVHPAYRGGKFKIFREVSDRIALREADMQKLFDVPLVGSLAEIRDVFLLACHSGIRWSDWPKLQDIINLESMTIELRSARKTRKAATLPIHPRVQQIAVRIAGGFEFFGHTIKSEQRINKALKLIAQQAGLNDKVPQEITRGGVLVRTMHHKYELVSTHTARRTFATVNYLNGFNGTELARLMGFATERQLSTYLKLSQHDTTDRLRKFWGAA